MFYESVTCTLDRVCFKFGQCLLEPTAVTTVSQNATPKPPKPAAAASFDDGDADAPKAALAGAGTLKGVTRAEARSATTVKTTVRESVVAVEREVGSVSREDALP